MRSRGYCKTCMKYVIDDELVSCRNKKHDLKAHERDYDSWLSKDKWDKSKNIRQEVISKYGYVPESFDTNKIRDKILDEWIGDLGKGTYAIYGWGTRTGALPQAPVPQIKQDILMYSKKGEIIFNPMMERCPHLLIANYYGRDVLGQDICKKFFLHDVQKVKQKILSSEKLFPKNNMIVEEKENKFIGILQGNHFEMHLGDSRDISWLKDESVHFVDTSPPYWKCAKYGDEEGQVGTGSDTYDEFLSKLKDIYKECFRVLKKGRFIAVQVNDFRMGKFYMYHCDTIRLLQDVGFEPHDIRVYFVGRLSSIFASQLEQQKRSGKTHEYIIVMKKPESKSLGEFEDKKKKKQIIKKKKEEPEEDVYGELKDVHSVDKSKISQTGLPDSLNFYSQN